MDAVRARAKINLRLVALARETTGFHQIESIFASLELADELSFESGGAGIRLSVHGAELGPVQDNLVMRAAVAFHAATRIEPALHIVLHKHVPAGSGLGGGSSDAAATLLELNRIHGNPLNAAALHRIACGLGSDVPWFLSGAPFAVAWGRGERCLRIPPPPDAAVAIGIADPPVSTAVAYAELAAARAETPQPPPVPLPDAARLATWDGIASVAHNDFEHALPRLHGARTLLEVFTAAGARIARLTGSGSAVFGIFDDDATARAAADSARQALPHATLIATRTAFR